MSNEDKQNRRPPVGGGGPMGGVMPVVKAKNFKKTLKRLIVYLNADLIKLSLIVLFAVCGTIFAIVAPKILAQATNALQNGIVNSYINLNKIGGLLLIVFSMYCVSAIFSFISNFMASGISQKIVYRMRQDIKDKLQKLPVAYYDKTAVGDILSRITNDIDLIATSLQQSLIQAITSIVTIIGILIMMFTISFLMTLIALLTLPIFAVITLVISKKSQQKFKAQQKSLGEINGYIEEMYSAKRLVRLSNKEDEVAKEFLVINEELTKTSKGAHFLAGIIMPMLNFVNNIGYTAICVVGGLLVGAKTNPLMIGDIQAFIQYSNQFSQPIMQTANIANTIQSTIAAAERVFEILDESEEPEDKIYSGDVMKLNNNIEFENVCFSYSADKKLIQNLNLTVNSGDKVAIVGSTGAGKTTLVNLLLRFYEISSGSIKIGGVDIRDIPKKDLRSLFGMVLQDTWLTSETIADNIAYANPGASDEMIADATEKAHIDFYIKTLKDGYETVLNEEGSNVSAGQKQLLTIARAILADPKVLILDEATSSVDTRTESYIQNAMTNMMEGRTSFVIAHRLSTIRNANLILVMEKGDIVEKGCHEDLMNSKGVYFKLYQSQFQQ